MSNSTSFRLSFSSVGLRLIEVLDRGGPVVDDNDARELLSLLYEYVKHYGNESPTTIVDLAADLAMSMDVTTGEDDRMRNYIEATLA